MNLNRLQKIDGEFSCKSCDKKLVDFRDKNPAEISKLLQESTCGIFDKQQLSNQSSYSGFNKWAFKMLLILSFLGLNVKPLEAQNKDTLKPVSHLEKDSIKPSEITKTKAKSSKKEKKDKASKKSKRKFFRRNKRVIMGCPEF